MHITGELFLPLSLTLSLSLSLSHSLTHVLTHSLLLDCCVVFVLCGAVLCCVLVRCDVMCCAVMCVVGELTLEFDAHAAMGRYEWLLRGESAYRLTRQWMKLCQHRSNGPKISV